MEPTNDGYFLNWNHHANNFSLAFSDLLQGDKLIDVQLVAEGNSISAHRLVLSAMSPYFCKMFTQMPVNQQAFVFLKDISKQTVADLITYIYRGEVNVKQDCLDKFMEAAQSLNIKGLTNSSGFQWFDSRPSTSASHETTFSGSLNQTADFKHHFGSTADQYQSVQRSAKSKFYQQPMNESQAKVNMDFHHKDLTNDGFGVDAFSHYQNSHEGSCNSNKKRTKGENESFFDQWNSELETGSNNNEIQMMAMPAKRAKTYIDNSKYDIVADIRSNVLGCEQLFHNNNIFNKHRKPVTAGQQRWRCQKESKKCRAAASTLNVNGVIMMKVLCGDHNHEPTSTN